MAHDDYSGAERRQMDIARDELFQLIDATESRPQKAQLLVMLKMYDAIVENTKIARAAAQDISEQKEQFNDHVKEEMGVMAKGQGMYKTSMFFLSILQIILASVVGSFYQDWKVMKVEITENLRTTAVLKERVDNVDAKLLMYHPNGIKP